MTSEAEAGRKPSLSEEGEEDGIVIRLLAQSCRYGRC